MDGQKCRIPAVFITSDILTATQLRVYSLICVANQIDNVDVLSWSNIAKSIGVEILTARKAVEKLGELNLIHYENFLNQVVLANGHSIFQGKKYHINDIYDWLENHSITDYRMVQVNDNILLDTNISNVGYRVYEYMLLIKSEPKTAIELSEELNISIRHLRNHLKILVEQNYFTIVKPLVGRSIIRYTINSQRVEEDE